MLPALPAAMAVAAAGRLAEEAAAMAGAVRGALGPRGGRALVLRPDGRPLLTRDGRRLLEALCLQPPTARAMAAAACRHRGATGDGAKTFVLLLAALLRGLRAAGGIGRALPDFQRTVLEPAAALGLRRHLLSAFPGGEAERRVDLAALEALLDAYLRGRVGPGERPRLARLCCELLARCAACSPPALRLLGRHFGALHATVPGLPLQGSTVLPGVLLRRDFAAYSPSSGAVGAVLVSEPLHAALSAPGVELVVSSEGQYEAARRWCEARTEAVVKRLQSSNVKLLLSSVKQHDAVVYYAKLHGVSLVECLSSEEVDLIRELTGVSPYSPSGDQGCGEITDTAVATFCRPLLLGSNRYVHIGFASSTCAFQPHCLVLCGPVDGVNEQHAAAVQGAFTMLQQLFKTVDGREEWGSKGESQNDASDACSRHSSATQKQFTTDNIYCNRSQVSEHQLKTDRGETETQILDSALQGSENPAGVQTALQTPSNPALHSEELSIPCKGAGSSSDAQEPHAKCKCSGEMHKDLEKASGGIIPFKPEEGCVSPAQKYSSSIIEAGSVLPVGGYFEILLHYYIQYYAKQLQQSAVTVISSVVADALLIIPKSLYGTTEGNSFAKFYLNTTNALRKNQPLPVNEKGLESVYCKYQLVISVLHCVTELLNIDLIIGVKRPLQKIEDNDSDDDF
uniref:Bardet-Biedl syndrome 10 n=1 Tax=Anas platyrhynchos TaxID=8839 RepID=A0A8B9QSZ6_ANAPL